MTFSINSKSLLIALNLTSKGISANNITPSASCYRFHKNDGLEISTCNLEISMQTSIACEIAEPLDILIPADKITQLLSSLPDQPLAFTIDGTDITIKSASGEYALAGYSADDYPVIKTETDNEITLPAEDLAEAIYATGYARSVDALMAHFTAVNMGLSETGIAFVGCNHLLMSVFKIAGKFATAQLLIPPSLISAMPSLPGDVVLSYSKNSVSLQYDGLLLKSILLDGAYPDWQNFVPKNDILVTVDRALLLASVKRVLQFSNKISNQIALKSENGTLSVSGENSVYNQRANETLPITGGDIQINVNGQYLSDALSHIGYESVDMYWSAPNVAMTINEHGDKNNFIMVMAMFGI